jgi:hypothetical protein
MPLIVNHLFLLALCACTQERPSPIVRLTEEEAGAGPLAGVSTSDMAVWLNGHPQVATRVDALCASTRVNARAAWAQTTEGRLCVAARAVETQRRFFHYTPAAPDHRGFLPGWR